MFEEDVAVLVKIWVSRLALVIKDVHGRMTLCLVCGGLHETMKILLNTFRANLFPTVVSGLPV